MTRGNLVAGKITTRMGCERRMGDPRNDSNFGNGEVGGDNSWSGPVHGTTDEGQEVTNLDLITNMHNEVPFAKDTILLVDILTANRDIVSLKTLHDINMTFILNNVIDPDISITEINEYIEEVIRQLEKGVDPDSIRKTKDTFIIQQKHKHATNHPT